METDVEVFRVINSEQYDSKEKTLSPDCINIALQLLEEMPLIVPKFNFKWWETHTCFKCNGDKQLWNANIRMMEDCSVCYGRGKF